MEPEGSLPCSQQPATVPYPDSMYPVHTFPQYVPKIHSNIIYHLHLDLPSGLFPSSFFEQKFV